MRGGGVFGRVKGAVGTLHVLFLVLVLAVGALAQEGKGAGLCDAEGECVPLHPGHVEVAAAHHHHHDEDDQAAAGGGGLRATLDELVRWIASTSSGNADELNRWLDPRVVVEAERTPFVPWRGRFDGPHDAAAFFARLRDGLFSADGPSDDDDDDDHDDGDDDVESSTGLKWSTAAIGRDAVVVRWEPSEMTTTRAGERPDGASAKREECGMWIHAWAARGDGEEGSARRTKLRRLVIEHTRPLQCGAAFRTRAQRAFTNAFACFFKLDYDGFRRAFDPNVTITWHGDAPVGKVFHNNVEELNDYIRTRVQIFNRTRVEFDPIASDDVSASYTVIFRPLTLRSTGEVFGEVRGLVVVRINEDGLIENYQMTIMDHYTNMVLALSLSE